MKIGPDGTQDRIISGIQQVHDALSKLGERTTIKVVVLSRVKWQFSEQEIRTALIDGVEFTVFPDITEVLQSDAVFDLAILCCHVAGEEATLFQMRQRGLATLYAVWFWDNHHHMRVNLRTAMLADLVFVSHWHARHYLNFSTALASTHIPAFSRQWPPGAIDRHYPSGLPAERRNALFGGFGRYTWTAERNSFIEAVAAACPDNSLTFSKVDDYFRNSAADRLKAWVEHKVQLIVPVNRDVSTRIFDSLITGQIPLVPDDLPDFDRVIGLELQATLPIVRYKAGDVESAKAGWQQALELFDRTGAEGVRQRHEFVRHRHSLAARLADFVKFLRSPGEFKLLDNGEIQSWERWR